MFSIGNANVSCPFHQQMNVCTCKTCGGEYLCVYCLRFHKDHEISPIPGESDAVLQALVTGATQAQKALEESVNQVSLMNERVEAATQTALWELRSWIHYYLSGVEKRNRELKEYIDVVHRERLMSLQEQSSKMELQLNKFKKAVRAAETCISEKKSISSSTSDEDLYNGDQLIGVCNVSCPSHQLMNVCTCKTCGGEYLCVYCIRFHKDHEISPISRDSDTVLQALVTGATQAQKALEDSVNQVSRMNERVEAATQTALWELRSWMNYYLSGVEERNRELKEYIDVVHRERLNNLQEQSSKMELQLSKFKNAVRAAETCISEKKSISSSSDEDPNNNGQQIRVCYEKLLDLFCQFPDENELLPCEVDHIKFQPPDASFYESLRVIGELQTSASPKLSSIVGDTFKRAICDRANTFLVEMRDPCGRTFKKIGKPEVTLIGPHNTQLDVDMSNVKVGIVKVSYVPLAEGTYKLNVSIRGKSIVGCPTEILVRRGRKYADLVTKGPIFSFGKEGDGDGELCRPWGICCDVSSRIIVSDRSNNRIQVFDKFGKFLFKFGSAGAEDGQFDRPAGVCANSKRHIIVADKDNHRVQVFDENGKFLLKFGDRGRSPGFFNYPWGVDARDTIIAVCDTRNHRVQLFTSEGMFLKKCGYDHTFIQKHLDSPRGVCFLPEGQLAISDFNNHRLALLPASCNSIEMKCFGTEGQEIGMFCRPQGIAVDSEGHLLMCDSRNNRIQVIHSGNMSAVTAFGGFRDCPTDEALPSVSGESGAGRVVCHHYRRSEFKSLQELVDYVLNDEASPENYSHMPLPHPSQGLAVLDRPCDLCVSPDGLVYVVDFGNSCIRVF